LKDGRLYGHIIDILNQAAPVMLLAMGMTLVIATGGVDLSSARDGDLRSVMALLIAKPEAGLIGGLILTLAICFVAGA